MENTNDFKIRFLDFGLITLIAYLILEWILSMSWRQVHDLPILNYVAYLINVHNIKPYKELFETSMPGVVIFHVYLTKIIGYSDISMRIFDAFYFCILAFFSYRLFSKIDKKAAIIGICFFGIYYLWEGHSMSLERDYIAILPIVIAINLMIEGKRNILSGCFWAIAFWIKPHILIGLIPVIGFLLYEKKLILKSISYHIIGFVLVSLLVSLWLISKDAWLDWWSIFTNYLPLHIKMPHNLQVLKPEERGAYLWKGLATFGQQRKWFLPLIVFIIIEFLNPKNSNNNRKPLIITFVGLIFMYWLYTAISGQFWKYHWMPFKFFLIMTSSLVFSTETINSAVKLFRLNYFAARPNLLRFIVLAVLIEFSTFYAKPISTIKQQLKGEKIVSEKNKLSDEIADLILKNTNPNDKIQVLDWTEGSIQSLLQTKRQLATSFLYDYVFYHQITNPYVQNLRIRFLKELNATKPKWIIEMKTRIIVTGEGTSQEFDELENFKHQNYAIFMQTEKYCIWTIKQ